MQTANDYNYSDYRRWDVGSPRAVFGVSSYTRAFVNYDEHTKKGTPRSKGGEGGYGKKRCQGEKTRLRREHKASADHMMPFKRWLREIKMARAIAQ